MGEGITWHPMGTVSRYGDAYTANNLPTADASRQAQVIPEIVATVIWKPGRDNDGNSPVATGSILVEVDRRFFPYGIPRKGDWIECPDQDPGEQILEIGMVADDGGQRIEFWCKLMVTK